MRPGLAFQREEWFTSASVIIRGGLSNANRSHEPGGATLPRSLDQRKGPAWQAPRPAEVQDLDSAVAIPELRPTNCCRTVAPIVK